MVSLRALLIAFRAEPQALDLLNKEKFLLFGFEFDTHRTIDIELLGALSRLERFRHYDSAEQRIIAKEHLEDVNYILDRAGRMGIYSTLMV